MKILIRDLVAADLSAVAALEAGEPGGWSLGQWTAELARAGGWRLAALDEDGGRLIGYMAGMVVGEEAEIFRLLVAPDCRRRRVATGLLKHLWRLLPGLRVSSCFLEVRSANLAALELYRAMGFVRCGLRPGYYHDPEDDAVVLARPVVSDHEAPSKAVIGPARKRTRKGAGSKSVPDHGVAVAAKGRRPVTGTS